MSNCWLNQSPQGKQSGIVVTFLTATDAPRINMLRLAQLFAVRALGRGAAFLLDLMQGPLAVDVDLLVFDNEGR